jgi:hypothetical protein
MFILYRSIMRLGMRSTQFATYVKDCALTPARSLLRLQAPGLTLCGRTGGCEGFVETFDQAGLVARLGKKAEGARF